MSGEFAGFSLGFTESCGLVLAVVLFYSLFMGRFLPWILDLFYVEH
jgi:hypothetical protein